MLYWPFHSLGRYSKWLRQCSTVPIRRRNSKHVLFDTSSSPRLAVASSASSVRSRIPTCRISALYFFHAGSPRGSGFPGLCTSYCPSSPSLCNAAFRPAVPGSPEFRSASTEHIHLPRVQASIHQQSLASRAYSVEQSAICLSLNIIPAAPLWRFYAIVAFLRIWRRLQMLRLTQLLTYLLYILKVRQQVIFKDEELEVI